MIDFFHLDYYVQEANNEAPIQKTISEISQPITLTQQIVKLLSLDILEVSTDNGILVEDLNSVFSYQRK
jgi:hypothetical protein